MSIRDLRSEDIDGLADLIREIYAERPSAMWFESPPDGEAIRKLFEYKINGISEGRVIDIVSEEGGKIIGECEVVNLPGGVGYLGILVRKGFRMQGIGKFLLISASDKSRALGTSRLKVDVTEDNLDAIYFFTKNGFRRLICGDHSVSINGSTYRVITLGKEL